MPTDPENEDQTDRRQDVDCRQEARPDPCCIQRDAADLVGLLSELGGLHPFGTETLDHPNTGHALFNHRRQRCLTDLDGHHGRMDRGAEPSRREVDERQRCKGEQGQQRIAVDEQNQDRDQLEQVADHQRDHHDERLQLLQVARCAAHQLTRLGVIVIADVQAEDVIVQPLAQTRFGGPALAEGEPPPPTGEHTRDDADRADDQRPLQQRFFVGDAPVDTEPDQCRDRDLRGGPSNADQYAGDQPSLLFGENSGQQAPRGPFGNRLVLRRFPHLAAPHDRVRHRR